MLGLAIHGASLASVLAAFLVVNHLRRAVKETNDGVYTVTTKYEWAYELYRILFWTLVVLAVSFTCHVAFSLYSWYSKMKGGGERQP